MPVYRSLRPVTRTRTGVLARVALRQKRLRVRQGAPWFVSESKPTKESGTVAVRGWNSPRDTTNTQLGQGRGQERRAHARVKRVVVKLTICHRQTTTI